MVSWSSLWLKLKYCCYVSKLSQFISNSILQVITNHQSVTECLSFGLAAVCCDPEKCSARWFPLRAWAWTHAICLCSQQLKPAAFQSQFDAAGSNLGPYKREGDSTIFYLRPNETHARPMSPSSLRALSPEWAAGGAINSAFKASSLGRGEEGTIQGYHIKSLYKLNFCFFSWDEVQPTTLHTILAACILCYYCCACYYCGQGGDIEWSFLVPLSSMLYLWRQDLDFSNKTRDRERERYGPLHDRANHHDLVPTLARVPFYSKFRDFEYDGWIISA